jgi:hypothetical protein
MFPSLALLSTQLLPWEAWLEAWHLLDCFSRSFGLSYTHKLQVPSNTDIAYYSQILNSDKGLGSSRSLVGEIILAALAAGFLGFGTFFTMLWTGLYV